MRRKNLIVLKCILNLNVIAQQESKYFKINMNLISYLENANFTIHVSIGWKCLQASTTSSFGMTTKNKN